MKICFFGSDVAYKGGIQNLSTNIIKHVSLNKDVDEVFVVCDQIDKDIYKLIKHKKLRIHCVRRPRKSDFLRIVLRNIRYRRLPKEQGKFDILHVLDDRAFPLIASNYQPLIVTVHDIMMHEFLIQLKTIGSSGLATLPRFIDHYQPQLFLEFLSVAKANRVIVNSPIIAERLQKLYGNIVIGKTKVIPPGFDPNRFNPYFMSKPDAKHFLKLDASAKVLLHVGGDKTSARRKGLPYVLQALEYIQKTGQMEQLNLWLLIVGEFAKNWMHQFANLRKRIIQLPYLNEDWLPVVYRAAETLLMPSTSEGWGITLMEALACGTPVIASPYVPSAFATQDTDVVYIEPEVENPKQFAKTILEKVGNDSLQDKPWSKIFDFLVLNYSWKGISESYLNLYREIIERGNHRIQKKFVGG